MVLLLIDDQLPERPERPRPEHIRIAYRVAPATATTIALGVVAATVGGAPGALAQAVLEGAREALRRIDVTDHPGAHPHVGAVDVAPIVYLDDERRGAAVAEALVLADLIGADLDVPVFLYGALAGGRARAK